MPDHRVKSTSLEKSSKWAVHQKLRESRTFLLTPLWVPGDWVSRDNWCDAFFPRNSAEVSNFSAVETEGEECTRRALTERLEEDGVSSRPKEATKADDEIKEECFVDVVNNDISEGRVESDRLTFADALKELIFSVRLIWKPFWLKFGTPTWWSLITIPFSFCL